MRSISNRWLSIVLCTLLFSLAAASAAAQEKEKPKPGSTLDTWRQSLPPDTEVQRLPEEMPTDAAPSPNNIATQKVLLALERRWMDSLKVGDADTLNQIISDDFAFASSRAVEVKDRIKYLRYGLGDLKLTSYEFDKATVRLFGRTAIVSSLLKQKATVRGEDWSGNYLVTDVWINREGNWRVVSRHESPLQEQK